jgi:hypothetical protein
MHIDNDGETGFEQLLGFVAAFVRNIDIRWKCCPHLGTDEAWLLQLVGALQNDRLAEAAAILADWLPAGIVRRAIGPAQAFAAALATRGLAMPRRPAELPAQRSAVGHAHMCASDRLH